MKLNQRQAVQDLAKLQESLFSSLLQPHAIDRQQIETTFKKGAQLDAAQCLSIYQRSYILRLRECLAEQFPATCYTLGKTLFEDFTDQYLKGYPSSSYTLYDLGLRFTTWLEENRPDQDLPKQQREPWIDFLVELSRYEFELFRLFDAEGNEGKLWPTIDTHDQQLHLQPCLSLMQFEYPVAWYYHEVRANKKPQPPIKSNNHTVILRRNYKTASYPVSPVHFYFLKAIKKHQDIHLALQDVAKWAKAPLEAVKASWQNNARNQWIDAGFFSLR